MSDETPELYETVGPHDKTNAMPAPIVEKIRSYDELEHPSELPPSETLGDYQLPEMELPGFGGVKYDDCGDELPHACECCGAVVGVGRTCDCNTCSRCAASWCRRRATEWAAKLMQLKGYRYVSTQQDQHYHHITVSPPDDFTVDDSETPRKAGRAIVREVMDELGVEGVAVYHPYRGKNEEKPSQQSHPSERYEKGENGRENDDRNEWGARLFEGREWSDDVREELKYDPHWHVVGVGGWVRGGQLTKAVEDATGWVIHRITPDHPSKTHSIKDDAALARVLAYVHSHAGLRETEAGTKRVESTLTGEYLQSDPFEVSDETHDRAEQLVREEAWRVLGIPSATMTCHENHLQPSQDDDEEQYGAGEEAETTSDPEGANRTACGGALVAINEYNHEADELYWKERLQSDEWRENARYPIQVEEALNEWLNQQQPDSPLFDVLTAG